MLGLPASTEFDKRLPRQKMLEHASPAARKAFKEQVLDVFWRNKLAVSTMKISAGVNVTEIEVLEVRLASPAPDMAVLALLDRIIPYHIVFVLVHEDRYQAVMGYKEIGTTGAIQTPAKSYYQTGWMKEEELPLHLEGDTLDEVYENFVRQVAGDRLGGGKEEGTSLKEDIESQKRREQLEKMADMLKAKMRKEKQLNRKMEIKAEIKKIMKELEKA